MANDIEVTLKLNDELTKGMKKVNDVMDKSARATAEQTKAFIEAGASAQGFSEDVIGAEEELTKLFLAEQKAAKEGISLAEAMDTSGEAAKKLAEDVKAAEKAQKASDKQAKKVSKGLGGMAKGFLGVATAYAGGRAIVGFAKDSLDAAKAAGTLAPEIGDLSAAILDLKVLVGTGLGGALAPIAEGATNVITSHTDVLKGVDAIDKAYEDGKITLDQQAELFSGFGDSLNTQLDLQREITKTAKERIKAGQVGRGKTGRDPLSDEMIQRRRGATREPIRVPVEAFFAGLDTDIASQIQSAMEKIDFEAAGGRELVSGFEDIFASVNVGEIGAGLGDQLFGEMFVQAQQIQVELGNITATEAARNIQAELGGTLQEALNQVRDIEGVLESINGLKVRAQIIIDVNTKGGVAPGVNLAGVLGGQEQKKGRAAGGGVTAGRMVLVGERGPELFNPGVSGTISPNDQLGGSTAGIESRLDNLAVAISNMGLDIQQSQAEARG